MEEEEEKKKKEETVQEVMETDKDEEDGIVLWGEEDDRAGKEIPRVWEFGFNIKSDEAGTLEKYKPNSIVIAQLDWLIKEFEDHKLPLSSNAVMYPLFRNRLWRIEDGGKEYEIRQNKLKTLSIYSERVF